MSSIPDTPEEAARWPYGLLHLPDDHLRDMHAVPERGVGSGWDTRTLSVEVPGDLTCPNDPPCTDLLADPASVIEDEERWPDHLCGTFLVASAGLWAQASIYPTEGSEWLDWQAVWPLPVGEKAVEAALQLGPSFLETDVLCQAPFKGFEEALWALRVADSRGSVDLFGLRGSPGGTDSKLGQGELKYVLRGSGTGMFGVIENATRWWDRLRGETTGGRPAGIDRWGSFIEFWIGLRTAMRGLRKEGRRLTQENIAERLGCSDRELRRWLKQYGIGWKDVLRIP